MHWICTHARAFVHQCGNATYHYPLLHGTHGVTLATGCFDREDVAVRLEELGVSTHVRSCPNEQFVDTFATAVHACVAERPTLDSARRAAIAAEITRTTEAFDIAVVIEQALSRAASRPS
jgi:UDP:flavonoid glycosyltransferase YjiC (YdhE family)